MADTNPGPAVTSTGSLVATISNVREAGVFALVLSPAAVAAATSAEQTFALDGVGPTDFVSVNKPTAQAGIGIVGARSAGANLIGITFMNATAAAVTPTAGETYLVKVEKLVGQTALTSFPY